MSPRAVITGIGLVSTLGCGVRETLAAIATGRKARGPVSAFDARGFCQSHGAEIRDFNAREYFRLTKALKLADRTTQFAVAAAALALRDADWRHTGPSDRLGVAIGCSGSDMRVPDIGRALSGTSFDDVDDAPVFADRMLTRLNPLWLLTTLPNMSSAHVAIQLEARGPNTTVMSDWAAGLQAIGEACEWIRAGEADAVLAGGADTGVTPLAYAAFEQGGLFAGPAPFVPGEGAAIFLIENADSAVARGAQVLGEVVGYQSAAVPADDPARLSDGMAGVLLGACTEAAWDPGERSRSVRCASFEPWLGHALAAAAPIDLALSLRSGTAVANRAGKLCFAAGPSGQMAALAVGPENHRRSGDTHAA